MNGAAGGSLRLSDSKRIVSKATAQGPLNRFDDDSSGHLPRFNLGFRYQIPGLYVTYGSPE